MKKSTLKIILLLFVAGIALSGCASTERFITVNGQKRVLRPWTQSVASSYGFTNKRIQAIKFYNALPFTVTGTGRGVDIVDGTVSTVDTTFTGTVPQYSEGKIIQFLVHKNDATHYYLEVSYTVNGSEVRVFYKRQSTDASFILVTMPEKNLDYAGAKVVYSKKWYILPTITTDIGQPNILLFDMNSLNVNVDIFGGTTVAPSTNGDLIKQ